MERGVGKQTREASGIPATAKGKEGTWANLGDLASPLTRAMILEYGEEPL